MRKVARESGEGRRGRDRRGDMIIFEVKDITKDCRPGPFIGHQEIYTIPCNVKHPFFRRIAIN
jgi:hypothetical protein